MAVKLSRRLARFNRSVINPLQLSYAWLLPPWVVICHRGRRSGQRYRTPVNAYRRGGVLAAVMLYGEESDWVRNVLAAGGQVVRGGRTYDLAHPRVVGVDAAGPEVPPAARRIGRLSGKLFVAELEGPVGGFGRGPGRG